MVEKLRSGAQSILLVTSRDYARGLSAERAEALVDALVADADEELSDEARAALAGVLVRGELALVRLKRAFRPLDRPKVVDLGDLLPEAPPPKREDRPTWIAVVLCGPSGETYPEANLKIRLPDGTTRSERVQPNGSWRADDVATDGTCHVELVESGPAQPGSAPPPENAETLPVGGPSVGLVTGREHVLVVTLPSFEAQLLDHDGRAIGAAAYRLTLPDGSVREGELDAEGFLKIEHVPPGECELVFPELETAPASADSE